MISFFHSNSIDEFVIVTLPEKEKKRICCIELINNNNLYINYGKSWTIHNHKLFKSIYPQLYWQINAKYHLHLFDVHLSLYRTLKEEKETKLSFDIKLEDLRMLGLLKDDNYPTFIFKDNRNNKNIISDRDNPGRSSKIKYIDDVDFLSMYTNYLPRVNTIQMLNIYPQLGEYYTISKKGLNKISKYHLNQLISDDQNVDWFVYDDESMNFLVKYERYPFKFISDIYFINNTVYLEDYYPSSNISNVDLENMFVNLIYIPKSQSKFERIVKKYRITSETTMNDLFFLLNTKMNKMKKTYMFNPRSKILKVKSKSEYVFDLNIPLVCYVYISECVKNNVDPIFSIIDNPFFEEDENIDDEDVFGELDNIVDMVEIPNKREIKRKVSKSLKDNISAAREKKIIFNIATYDSPKNENINKNMNQFQFQKSISIDQSQKKPQNLFMNCVLQEIKDQLKENIDQPSKDIDNLSIKSTDETTTGDLSSNLKIDSVLNSFRRLKSSNKIETSPKKAMSTILRKTMSIKKNKDMSINLQANILTEYAKTNVDISSMLELKNQKIPLSEMKRPFSLIIRNAFLKQTYNSIPFKTNSFLSLLIFKFQIYGGNKKLSNKWKMRWSSSTEDHNPTFNKRIYFDLNYNTLPFFAGLMIKLKHIQFNKKNEIAQKEKIFWAYFKLFDHNKKLRTGIHKICFNEYPLNSNSFFCFSNKYYHKSSAIYFELDSFSHPILSEAIKLRKLPFNMETLIISSKDKEKINNIKRRSPFAKLDNYDKDVLWSNRYYLTQDPMVFTKVLSCINYKNGKHLIELEQLLNLAKPVSLIEALKLLTANYFHTSIRKYAVKCLEHTTPGEIEPFFIQLVQGLKYEMYHDSDLAKFLLGMAIRYPLTIGHTLFWNLKSEMDNKYFQQRFCLYLEIFLNKIGNEISKLYENEVHFVKQLHLISGIPKDKTVDKYERICRFEKALVSLNYELQNKLLEVSIPYDFKLRIKSIKVDKCRIMKSKKKPLWLVFENSDPDGEDIIILYKAGDDLRMDIVTIQLFRIMQSIWFENKLKLKMTLYNVICTGPSQGIVEIVKNAETLAQIHIKEGGALTSFSRDAVKNWLNNNYTGTKEEVAKNFLSTCVAYCVATFVLGIGDRHNDNIMLKKNGELFHIDFGHFLGHFKYKMGVKRERAPFVFTKQFQSILENEETYNLILFKKKFAEAYLMLRENSDKLVTVLQFLLSTGIPELTEKSIKFLIASLCLNDNSTEAKKYLETQFKESLNSISVELNFWIHIIANK